MGTGSSSEKIKVEGVCEKQYEPVKEHLLEMLTKGKEENVQLCVYVNGKCVVDLYGTAVGDTNYNHDKLQVFCILHEIHFEIPYVCHYKPWLVYFLPHFQRPFFCF